MAKAGFRIIDAEPHFFEPHDLWERNLEEPFRSLTKTTSTAPGRIGEGGLRPEVVGLEVPKVEANPLVQRRALRRVPQVDHMAKVTARPEPDVFIEGFDVEGIDIGVLMPTYAMGMVRFDDLDPAHAVAICRVYNDYAARFVR